MRRTLADNWQDPARIFEKMSARQLDDILINRERSEDDGVLLSRERTEEEDDLG